MKKLYNKYRYLEDKYGISFYFGLVGKLALLGFSIYSAITLSARFYGLVILYSVIIFIRVVTFFWDKVLRKKYNDDKELLFRNKHFPVLFTGSVFLIHFALSFIISLRTDELEPTGKPFMLVFFVVVPWALIRLTIEIIRIAKFKRKHDPFYRTRTFVNIISVTVTISNALTDVYLLYRDNLVIPIIIFIILMSLLLYWVTITVYLLVISILGILNKREKQKQLFISEENNKKEL